MTQHVSRDYGRLLTGVMERTFPNRAQRLEALRTLEQYGGCAAEPEAERVRLAILKLAGADIAQLQSGVLGAKEDYEDMLSWAESPTETEARIGNRKLAPDQWAEIVAQDRRQYKIGFTVMPPKSSNHAMERTGTASRLTFNMPSKLPLRATRALVRRRSSRSR